MSRTKQEGRYYRLEDADVSPKESPKLQDEKKLKGPLPNETTATRSHLEANSALVKLQRSKDLPKKLSMHDISDLILEIIEKGNKDTISQLDKLILDNSNQDEHPVTAALTKKTAPLLSYRDHESTSASFGINKLLSRILRRLATDPGNEETQAALHKLSNTCGFLGMPLTAKYDSLAQALNTEQTVTQKRKDLRNKNLVITSAILSKVSDEYLKGLYQQELIPFKQDDVAERKRKGLPAAADIHELPADFLKKHEILKLFPKFSTSNSSAPKEVKKELTEKKPETDFFKPKPAPAPSSSTAPKPAQPGPSPEIQSLFQLLNNLNAPRDEKSKIDLLESCGALILNIIKMGDETAIRYLGSLFDQPEQYLLKAVLDHSLLNKEVVYSAQLPNPSGILRLNTFLSAVLERSLKEQQPGVLGRLYDLYYLCGLKYQSSSQLDFLGTEGNLSKLSDPTMVIPKMAVTTLRKEYQSGVEAQPEEDEELSSGHEYH